MVLLKEVTRDYRNVSIHQVNGDVLAIEFLQNSDYRWVESLFLRAKQYGHADFASRRARYRLTRNHDLTYTVNEVRSLLSTEGG